MKLRWFPILIHPYDLEDQSPALTTGEEEASPQVCSQKSERHSLQQKEEKPPQETQWAPEWRRCLYREALPESAEGEPLWPLQGKPL